MEKKKNMGVQNNTGWELKVGLKKENCPSYTNITNKYLTEV